MGVALGEFKYSESRLADQLGVSRIDLKFLRDQHLRVDRDWQKNAGEVAFNVLGLKKIWHQLGDRPRALDLSTCLINGSNRNGNSADSPIPLGHTRMPIPTKMRVTRICDNPRVVLAIDEHGATCSVEVGRNENFVVGDEINTAPHSTQHGFWRLLGPIPRSRRRVGGKPI